MLKKKTKRAIGVFLSLLIIVSSIGFANLPVKVNASLVGIYAGGQRTGYAFSLIYSDTDKVIGNSGSGSGVYIVKSGDTLYAIAGRLGKSLNSLINKNNLENPDKLSVGQKIVY